MAVYKSFEDLKVWNDSRELNKMLFDILKEKDDKIYGFLVNHIYKTGGSIMDNIAEGFERDGNKEFIHFLSISKASAGELKSQLYRALDSEVINQTQLKDLTSKVNHIIAQLVQFMKYLQSSNRRGNKFQESEIVYEAKLSWEAFFNH
ncbi:MAG: four helix bundle protein [bacterium]|nr:four helix bundle protein [bacterium]